MTPWNVTRNALRSRRGADTGHLLRRVAAAWRAQTGGSTTRDASRKTLLACSGGADSTALALALCAAVSDAPRRFVIAHVVHDLRPRKDALKDRDHAKKLARWLGLPFVEAQVVVKGSKSRARSHADSSQASTNLEALARTKRYQALATLAKRNKCTFIATAHHLDDALETVLMRMMRGCGPAAMRGVMPVRKLKVGRTTLAVVRPMLGNEPAGVPGLTRAECETLCNAAGFAWRHDTTNDDTTRLRAALRTNVLPALRAIDPRVARRVVRSAHLCAQAGSVVKQRARALLKRASHEPQTNSRTSTRTYSRDVLAKAPTPVLREALATAVRLIRGKNKRDTLRTRTIAELARTIADTSTHTRRLTVAHCEVVVQSKNVTFTTK